ncbi:MAG: dependent protein [Chthoniobacter sp.]|jgi:pyridoxal phosphate enzyme (YggS family)|nr:dependent protein [Chthoniobacter sp.]
MSAIFEKLAEVRGTIADAAAKSGRAPGEVELVAVSKSHPPESVHEALDAGQLLFGESRVQEARVKIPLLPARTRWHFIGHLQKNKIRHALPLFELFHGIDSLALAQDLDRMAAEAGARPRVLLEVNVAGEASKFGFKPAQICASLEQLLALARVQIEGLMTIAPLATEAEMSRKYFAALRELRDQLQRESGIGLPHLSMGMSGDFAVAIEEGATLVRVGTAIFGARNGKAFRAPATEDLD